MRDYYVGFDLARIGGISVTIAATTYTISTGTFAHVDLSAVMGGGNYTALAPAIQALLPGTYSVAYDPTLVRYSITNTGTFAMTFPATQAGRNAYAILGFPVAGVSGSAAYPSTIRPTYLVRALIDAQSEQSDEYQPDGIVTEAVATGGQSYAIAPQSAPVQMDWTQPFESNLPPATFGAVGTAVFTRDLVPTVTRWAWQDFWSAASAIEPILLRDQAATAGPVFKMRAEGASFRPIRVSPDLQALWSMPFRTRLLGRLT